MSFLSGEVLFMPRPPRWFQDMKLKGKLILIVAVIITIFTSISLLSFRNLVSSYDELLYAQTANMLSQFSDSMNGRLEDMDETSQYVVVDGSFQEALKVLISSETYSYNALLALNQVKDVMNRYFSNDLIYMGLYYDSPSGQRSVFWGSDSTPESEDMLARLFGLCDEAPGKAVWLDSGRDDGSVLVARQILSVNETRLRKLGYLVFRVNLARIAQSVSRTVSTQNFTLAITTPERFLYPAEGFPDVLPEEFRSDQETYDIRRTGVGSRFLTFSHLDIPDQDWQMTVSFSYNRIFESVLTNNTVYIISIIAAVLLAVIASSVLVRGIFSQFHTLVGKIERVKLGNFAVSPTPVTAARDEFGQLNEYFDQMTVELKKLIDDSYVKQLLITQAEFKALEQQINPHFLYNTLNSIDWLAKKAGQEEISTIAESLGQLLRDTLSREDFISIEKELSIVQCYIRIQQIRFDTLDVRTEIDSSALRISIPKMTIQPLVENAILHSQEEILDSYRLILRVRRETEWIRIEVSNDGPPIDVHILDHLRDHSVKPKGNGVGLLNIDSRLRIIFGEKSGLYFQNDGGMTTVGFLVPVGPAPAEKGDESVNVQNADCR